MEILITFVLTFLVVAAVVAVLVRVRTPRYRVDRPMVANLLRMVLEGRANINDWNVFVGVPIRHDPELEDIRRRCLAIEQREFVGNANGRRFLFTRQGLKELGAILVELDDSLKPPPAT